LVEPQCIGTKNTSVQPVTLNLNLKMETAKVGNKVKFIGVPKHRMFWFPKMITDAEENLTPGQIYTLSEVTEASSWTGYRLVETKELQYNSTWFELL